MSAPKPGDTLTNSAGIDDLWSCPSCYADHKGYRLEDTVVQCECGARLKLTVEQWPVCRSTVLGDEDEDGQA